MGIIPAETAEIINEDARRIFTEGKLDERPIWEQIGEIFRERPFHESHAIRVAMETLARVLPTTAKQRLHEHYFDEIPLAIPKVSGFRILPKIGEGGANKVYLLNTRTDATEEHSYTVGQSIKNFSDAEKALAHAVERKSDYEQVSTLFARIPNLIPKERYLVYKSNAGKPAVMFIRDFVPGPLTDVFMDYTEEELVNLLKENAALKSTFEHFAQICDEHEDFVLGQHLDILGTNNLAIVGEKGQERLVLLDPHTIEKDENGTLPSTYRERIEARIQYINMILLESNLK